MKPALSQVCSLDAMLEKDVEDYAAGGCTDVELWVGKVDRYLESHTPADLLGLLKTHGVTAAVASFQGGILASQGERRQEHWATFARRLAQCQSLGVTTLVVAADIPGPLEQTDLERVQMLLGQAAELAGRHGVRLALEFQAHAAFANNLQTAAALVAEVSNPALGLCLDVFHFFTGPSKEHDLGYLTADNLFHVQFSDLSGVPREFAADADRILPGDGDLPLEPIVGRLREIHYQGLVSLELMNPQIWRIPPRQFGEIGLSALKRTLGIAATQ